MEAKLTRSFENFKIHEWKGPSVLCSEIMCILNELWTFPERAAEGFSSGSGNRGQLHFLGKGLHAFHNQSVETALRSFLASQWMVSQIPSSSLPLLMIPLSKRERWLVLNRLSVYPPAIKSTKWVVGFGVAWSLGELGETFLRTLRSKGQTS